MKKDKVKFTSVIYEVDGVEYTFAELCRHYHVKYNSVYNKMLAGMTIQQAINKCVNSPRDWGGK